VNIEGIVPCKNGRLEECKNGKEQKLSRISKENFFNCSGTGANLN
jgi:hypothetical protein